MGSGVGLERGALPLCRFGVAMSSTALGTGDVGLMASYTFLGACVRTQAEFDSPVFLLSTSLTRLPPIPWMTEILKSSSCQVRGSG